VEGFARVTLVERPDNWGLARSVIAGVTEICASRGRVIVLEDDLILSPHFLAYMNEALDLYAEDPRVYQVSGYQFPIPPVGKHDAAFQSFISSWGWATWQQAWAHFDPHMTGFARLQADRNLRKSFDLDWAYPFFRMLEHQRQGYVDSWAIRWYLSVFLRGGLTLFPARTLVANGGRDGTGTHESEGGTLDFLDFSYRVKDFPYAIEMDVQVYQAIIRHFIATKISPWSRIKMIPGKLWRIIA
jgi:GT2 family glycosyltransferase